MKSFSFSRIPITAISKICRSTTGKSQTSIIPTRSTTICSSIMCGKLKAGEPIELPLYDFKTNIALERNAHGRT